MSGISPISTLRSLHILHLLLRHLNTSLLGAVVTTICCILATSQAHAWVEHTITSHDTKVTLARNGTAHIQHSSKISVKGGPLRSIDVHIADKNITLTGTPTIVRTGGVLDARVPIEATAERRPDGVIRVDIANGAGIRRGTYELVLSYDTDLLQQDCVKRDGSLLTLTWIGPTWDNGIDSMRTTFAIPASPTSPTAVGEMRFEGPNDETVSVPLGAFFSGLSRLPEYDELELIRPHVASGEAVAWTVRFDPSALSESHDPRLHVPPPKEVVSLPAKQRASLLAIGILIAVAFSILTTIKHLQVSQSCRIRNVRPRPVVPLGIAVRMAFAGPLLAASIGAQIYLDHPLPGAAGILAAALLTAYRTPKRTVLPRGPGRWLPLSDSDAFERKEPWPIGWLDAGSAVGKVMFAFVMAAGCVGVWHLSKHSTYFACIGGLDLVVPIVLFGTGRRSSLPADPVHSAIPLLKSAAEGLRHFKELKSARVLGIARFPSDSSTPDELRLLIWPKKTQPGFRGIEIGIGWTHGTGGPLAMPQVLFRVSADSPCHNHVNGLIPNARWVRGREKDERVLAINPVLPTMHTTIALAKRVSQFACVAQARAAAASIDRQRLADRTDRAKPTETSSQRDQNEVQHRRREPRRPLRPCPST